MKRLATAALLAAPALAQFQNVPSTNYPALESILNSKPAVTVGAGLPVANCTIGKDWFYRTDGPPNWYICTGSPNVWSVQGAQGPQGVTGQAGPQGSTGSQGATGSPGPIGPTGVQGATGSTGATGANGPSYVAGATGDLVSIGAAGAPTDAGVLAASVVTASATVTANNYCAGAGATSIVCNADLVDSPGTAVTANVGLQVKPPAGTSGMSIQLASGDGACANPEVPAFAVYDSSGYTRSAALKCGGFFVADFLVINNCAGVNAAGCLPGSMLGVTSDLGSTGTTLAAMDNWGANAHDIFQFAANNDNTWNDANRILTLKHGGRLIFGGGINSAYSAASAPSLIPDSTTASQLDLTLGDGSDLTVLELKGLGVNQTPLTDGIGITSTGAATIRMTSTGNPSNGGIIQLFDSGNSGGHDHFLLGGLGTGGASCGAGSFNLYDNNNGSIDWCSLAGGGFVVPSLQIGGAPSGVPSGPSWTSGNGAPSGACTTGSMYSNTAGTTLATTLYVCVNGAWVGI